MRILVLAAAGALSLACAASALAQTSAPRTIRAGESVNGELQAKEVHPDNDWVVDFFDIQGTRGETVTITLKSDDFDPNLDLDRGEDHLVDDDDGGEILDSKLVFEFPETATYRINVSSSERDETGSYTLRVERGGTVVATEDDEEDAPPPRARGPRDRANPQPIRYGQTLQGRLTATSPLHRDDTPYLPYVFSGRKGEVVTVEMTAPDFDAYVVLQLPNDDEDLAKDDDGLEGTNAKLVFTLPVDGQYEIRANAVSEDAVGPFTLKLAPPTTQEALTRDARARAATLNVGQVTRGKIESSDPIAEDKTHYDLYRLTGKARQTVVIQLSSQAFDAYLVLTDAADKELATNDDAKEGENDAEIVFSLPADGEYFVRANTVGEDESGDYLLGLSVR